jgi:hypothetical protein
MVPVMFVGCASNVGSRSDMTVHKRENYTKQITDIIIGIKKDDLPIEFSAPLASNLKSLLSQRGITADVRTTSALDINPISQAEIMKHTYSMFCAKTHGLLTYSGALIELTLNCKLIENNSDMVVMLADIVIKKGWGFGFAQNEAENANQEILTKLEETGLISKLNSSR